VACTGFAEPLAFYTSPRVSTCDLGQKLKVVYLPNHSVWRKSGPIHIIIAGEVGVVHLCLPVTPSNLHHFKS
jgi:hypothetical protein